MFCIMNELDYSILPRKGITSASLNKYMKQIATLEEDECKSQSCYCEVISKINDSFSR